MPINALLRQLYDSLNSESDIRDLVENGTRESLYLEFKRKSDPTNGALGKGDAKAFSKALSGFANSDGGVLLWGVQTDREERASALHAITDVEGFYAALKSSVVNATQPVVDEVELHIILAGQGSGYVKCLVPSSEKTPHRAMLADREYYKRSAEGFYALEHFDLEDIFGRRPIPRLRLLADLTVGSSTSGSGGRTQEVRLDLAIVNEGRGSAIAPYLELICRNFGGLHPVGVTLGGTDALLRPVHGAPDRYTYIGSSDFVIHPGVRIPIGYVARQFAEFRRSVGDSSLSYSLAALNARLFESHSVFELADLLKLVNWTESGPA